MAQTNYTNRLAEELQKPKFLPFLEEWISEQINEAMAAKDSDRVIELGELRKLAEKAKGK